MSPRPLVGFLTAPLLVLPGLLATLLSANAGVTGRYVRYEAPTIFRDNIWDLEIYSHGAALTGDRAIEATAYRGNPWTAERLRHMLNGSLTSGPEEKRAPLFEALGAPTNVCIEVDLKRAQEIDEVKVSRPKTFTGPLRIVTVLDEKRKVVGSSIVKMTSDGANELDFQPVANGPYVGQVVPAGPGGWLPFDGLLPDYSLPALPDADQKIAAFKTRNSPQNTEKLARRFFGLMDLKTPELAEVRTAYEGGKFLEALTLYRDLWFKRIADTQNLWGHEIPGAHYAAEAEDLLRGKFSLTRFHKGNPLGVMVPFTPGAMPWGVIPADEELRGSFEGWNRSNSAANRFGRPLLTAYRKTGDAKYFNRWEEVTDDFSMNFIHAADTSPVDLRDYFVKEPLQNWNFFVFELAETAKAQPEFVKNFSPQTLARILLLAQEEYLAPYWRTERKTAFNHTFNALTAAYFATDSFRDFMAGQRLIRETQDHFERVTSYNTTRDGSMTEIGDDGHISMHMRLAISLRDILARKPDWISPALVQELKDRYAQMTRFQVRHMTPNGLTHRGAYKDSYENVSPGTDDAGHAYGGMDPLPMYQDGSVYQEPEIKAILESVYKERPEGKAVRAFYGDQSGTPATPQVVSDFMPYAGLYYLRNRWGGNFSSAHMVSPPVGHPSSNNVDETCVYFQGKGAPMLLLGGVKIDRESPDLEEGKPLAKPGSKTERLTESSPDPLNVRWYSGLEFDLAEALWKGPYGKASAKGSGEPSHPYGTVDSRRFLIQYRPADLWIAVDRIEIGKEASKIPNNYRFSAIGISQVDRPPQTGGTTASLEIPVGSFPGMEARFFASTPLSVASDPGNSKREARAFSLRSSLFAKSEKWIWNQFDVTGGGGPTFAGITLLQPQANGEQNTAAAAAREISGLGKGCAGFKAPLPGGGEISVFVAGGTPQKFSAGRVAAEASLLVVANDAKGARGIVLDAASFNAGGRAPVAAGRDFAFTVTNAGLTTTPILRPLRLPVISPDVPVFVNQAAITLSAPDKDAKVYYTLDGSEPIPGAAGTTEYTAPFTLSRSTLVKARAVRGTPPAGSFIPFQVNGTIYSAVQYANFEKKELLPAVAASSAPLRSGLRMDFLHDTWLRLFSFLNNPAEMPAEKSLVVKNILNAPDFAPLRDGDRYFGVRYTGSLDVPADGVYTFYLPEELAHHRSAVPGYDLEVFLDGVPWNPDFTWQGKGTWSVALARGLHSFELTYADVRTRAKISPNTGLWRGFPADHVVWKGEVPTLKVSGPGVNIQPIPTAWLKYQ